MRGGRVVAAATAHACFSVFGGEGLAELPSCSADRLVLITSAWTAITRRE